MTRHSPLQQLKEAKQIAQDHGCFVSERGGRYLLYRKTTPRPTLVGHCVTPEALRRMVCRATNFH